MKKLFKTIVAGVSAAALSISAIPGTPFAIESVLATEGSVTSVPTAKTLTYNGSNQTLVNAGTATGGTLVYKLTSESDDAADYASDLPEGLAAGDYNVFYAVVDEGGDFCTDNSTNPIKSGPVACSIAAKALTIGLPTDVSGLTVSNYATKMAASNFTASGLVDGDTWNTDVSATSVKYAKKTGESTYGTKETTITAGGTYGVYASLTGTKASNYSHDPDTKIGDIEVTNPLAGTVAMKKGDDVLSAGATVKVGTLLTAVPSDLSAGEGAVSYKWYAGGEAITGETTSSYTVAPTCLGKTLQVKVSKDGYTTTVDSITTAAVVEGDIAWSTTPVLLSDAATYAGSNVNLLTTSGVTTPSTTVKYAVKLSTDSTSPTDSDFTTSAQATKPGTYKVFYKAEATGYNAFTGRVGGNDATVTVNKGATQTIGDVTVTGVNGDGSVTASIAGKISGATGVTYKKGSGQPETTGTVTPGDWSVNATTGAVTLAYTGGEEDATITLPCVISCDQYADSNVDVVMTVAAAGTPVFENPTPTVTYGSEYTQEVKGITVGTGDTLVYSVADGSTDYASVDSTTGKVTPKQAGTATIKATYTKSEQSPQTATYTLTISQKEATAVAASLRIAIGAEVPTLSKENVTMTGLVSGDSLTNASIAYQKDGQSASPDNSKAGTYDIVISAVQIKKGETDVSSSYNVTMTKGTLTIGSDSSSSSGGSTVTPPKEEPEIKPGDDPIEGETIDDSTKKEETTTNPDGSTTTTTTAKTSDGKDVTIEETKGADGSSSKTTTVESETEKKEQTTTVDADGKKTESARNEDKTTGDFVESTKVTNVDGTTEEESAFKETKDGVVTEGKDTKAADGSTTEWDKETKTNKDYTETYVAKDKDGNITEERSSSRETAADGTVTEKSESKDANGSESSEKVTKGDGTGDYTEKSETKDAAGNVVESSEASKTTSSDGAVTETTKTVKDGDTYETEKKTATDGTSVETNKVTSADGSVESVTMNRDASGQATSVSFDNKDKNNQGQSADLSISGSTATLDKLTDTNTDELVIPETVQDLDGKTYQVTELGEGSVPEATNVTVGQYVNVVDKGAFKWAMPKVAKMTLTFQGPIKKGMFKKGAFQIDLKKSGLEASGKAKAGKGLTIYVQTKKDKKQMKKQLKKAGVPGAKIKVGYRLK